MTFGGIFSGFRPAFDPGGAVKWWLSGGIAAANCVAAYCPKGAASLAASYINLASPGTYDAAPGVAPPLGANGWTFNGSTQYLTTGIVPASGWSMAIRVSVVNQSSAGWVIGSYNGVGRDFLIQIYNSAAPPKRYYDNGAQVNYAGSKTATGVLAVSNYGYYNGSAETGLITPALGSPAIAIFLGAANNAGIATPQIDHYEQAAAIYNITLTAPQMLALATAMALL